MSLPPSPLAELNTRARERAAAVLARQLPRRALCDSCGELITWAWTPRGRQMPVDAEPVDHGTVALSVDTAGRQVATVVSRGQGTAARAAGVALHTSHFATCPYAGHHRRDTDRRRT